MAVSAKITLALQATQTGNQDLGSKASNIRNNINMSLANGTDADQINKMYADEDSLVGSATQTIDLAGTLVGPFGETITFTSIKVMLIVAKNTNKDTITIGGAASNTFVGFFGDATDTIKLAPGGVFMITNTNAEGYLVDAGTGDILEIHNDSPSDAAEYEIIILGD